MSIPRRDLHPVGDHGWMVDCVSLADAMGVHSALSRRGFDAVAGARTVLIRLRDLRRVQAALAEIPVMSLREQEGRAVTLEVVYDGDDLHPLARHLGWSAEALIRWHTGADWMAGFAGFAPGFMYCVRAEGSNGRAEAPTVPRLETPRTTVPAGSVALAGEFSAVYPRGSPGGWQLIGHTDEPLVDFTLDPPTRLQPGDRIRYRAVRESTVLTGASQGAGLTGPVKVRGSGSPEPAESTEVLEGRDARPAESSGGPPARKGPAVVVENPGLLALIEDRGRPGHADLGVTSGGVMDRAAAGRAAHLVGNPVDSAALELLFGGVRLRAHGDLVLAVTGAEVPLWVHGAAGESSGVTSEDDWSPRVEMPFALLDGQRLEIGQPSSGVRTYVAVRGGLDVPTVLGSRATDTLSGIGPNPVEAGAELAIGPPPPRAVAQVWETRASSWSKIERAERIEHPERTENTQRSEDAGCSERTECGEDAETILPRCVRVIRGPRDDWFTAEAWRGFLTHEWTVTGDSDRVGIRLDGEGLQRRRTQELPSEATVPGCIQIPSSGQPVVFMRDHPVTGGYPVIATVVEADLDLLAQLAPGEKILFREITQELPDRASPKGTSRAGQE